MLKENLRSQVLDGTLQDYKKHLSGVYKEYYICIDFKEPYYFARINILSLDTKKELLEEFLASAKSKFRHLKSYEFTDHELLLAIVQPNFKKNIPTVLNTVLEPIVDYLVASQISSGCGKCGKDEPVYCIEIKKHHHHYCEACATIAKQETERKKKWL